MATNTETTAKTWELSDHVCRVCLGRVLTAQHGERLFCRCSNCGIESAGRPSSICCCGIKLKTGKDAGIRCRRNPNPTPELPAEIIAEMEA